MVLPTVNTQSSVMVDLTDRPYDKDGQLMDLESFLNYGYPDLTSVSTMESSIVDSGTTSLLSTPGLVTISPAELFGTSSVPGTIMSTPFDSPMDVFDASPLFGNGEVGSSGKWVPLFEDSSFPSISSVDRSLHEAIESVTPTDTRICEELLESEQEVRKQSLKVSTSVSPSLPDLLHDDRSISPDSMILSSDGLAVSISERKRKRVTSQSYSRRTRVEPLPPIVVGDAEDCVAVKRARNTLAARRSRERKMLKLTDLEKQVEELLLERERASKKIKDLEVEVSRLKGI